MPGTAELKQRIIVLLKERGADGMRRCDLRRRLGVAARAELVNFRETFRELQADGTIIKKRRSRYILAESAALVSGVLVVNPRGFGFVTPAEGGVDIFIPPKGLDTAISGDRVLVAVSDEADERGPSGVVRKIVARAHSELTGRLTENDGCPCVRPLRRSLPDSVRVEGMSAEGEAASAQPGDWVVVRLLPQACARDPLRAEFVRRLTTGSTVSDDLDAVAHEYGLAPPYDGEQISAAARLCPRPMQRESLEHETVITIDPEDAKDFDDALSIHAGGREDTTVVGVHIADVAAYVPPGSELDACARTRAFTAYLPGRTLPMLPEPLASNMCSLVEGEKRLTHSVFLEISRSSGEVLAVRRSRTLIRVSRRLSFTEVQTFIEGETDNGWPVEVSHAVAAMQHLATAMRRRRSAREVFLDLAHPEIRVLCEGTPPRVAGMISVDQTEAHALVEEFMLAANSAVAGQLETLRIPALFRIHGDPKPSAIGEFKRWASKVPKLRVKDLGDRGAINRFLAAIRDRAVRELVGNALLSAMERAAYAAVSGTHYGLGKSCYCHFTSPIRRYPDLLVHQQLLAHELGEPARGRAECEDIAAQTSAAERNSDEAYYAAVDRLKLRYLRDLAAAGQALFYEGIVARIAADGLAAYVPELGMYGLVPRNLLGHDHFVRSRDFSMLKGRRSGKTYKCGDVIYVQIRRADTVKGVLHLQPVQTRV